MCDDDQHDNIEQGCSVGLITSLADLPVDAQSEALLLQLGELGILSQNRDI